MILFLENNIPISPGWVPSGELSPSDSIVPEDTEAIVCPEERLPSACKRQRQTAQLCDSQAGSCSSCTVLKEKVTASAALGKNVLGNGENSRRNEAGVVLKLKIALIDAWCCWLRVKDYLGRLKHKIGFVTQWALTQNYKYLKQMGPSSSATTSA